MRGDSAPRASAPGETKTEAVRLTRLARLLRVCACSTALVALAAHCATAQTPDADRAQIQELQKRIDELEVQIRALQEKNAEEKRAAESAAESAGQPPEGAHDMLAPLGLGALQIRGFNDIDFRTVRDGDNVNTFSLGQLDLFLSSRLSSDFSMLSEIVFEASDANAFGVDVERLLLQYSPNDILSVASAAITRQSGGTTPPTTTGTGFKQRPVGRSSSGSKTMAAFCRCTVSGPRRRDRSRPATRDFATWRRSATDEALDHQATSRCRTSKTRTVTRRSTSRCCRGRQEFRGSRRAFRSIAIGSNRRGSRPSTKRSLPRTSSIRTRSSSSSTKRSSFVTRRPTLRR